MGSEDEEEAALQSPNPVNVSYDEDQLQPSSDHEEEEEEEVQQRQRRKKDKKKKKKRKVKIMDASGQTDSDRRLLRKKQRDLHHDISFDGPVVANNNDNDDTSDEEEQQGGGREKSSRLAGWRNENNKLWDDVRYTREAVLDSENMDLISSKAAREVEKIIQVSVCIVCLFVVC